MIYKTTNYREAVKLQAHKVPLVAVKVIGSLPVVLPNRRSEREYTFDGDEKLIKSLVSVTPGKVKSDVPEPEVAPAPKPARKPVRKSARKRRKK